MAGIAKEETHTQKMYIFSSSLRTLWPSGDIVLYRYKTNIEGKFQVGSVQRIYT